MKSYIFYFVFFLLLYGYGCGYTTRAVNYKEQRIYISPVVNKINITYESRAYSSYNSYPVLLEKRLTNALVEKFNVDGHLSVSPDKEGALRLVCEIKDYRKEALRYTDNDEVTEQRLRLYVHIVLYGSEGNKLKEKDIIGETTYVLSGARRKTESSAQVDLVNDTARRIVDSVVEEW